MNVYNDNFFKSFEDASQGLVLALRIESGLESHARIVESRKGNVLVFATDDANSQTLKRFLCPILNAAVRDKENMDENAVEIAPDDHCDLQGRGMVSVELTPALIDYLTARLQ